MAVYRPEPPATRRMADIDADLAAVGAYKLRLRRAFPAHDWRRGVPKGIREQLAAANADLERLLKEDDERQRAESFRRRPQ